MISFEDFCSNLSYFNPFYRPLIHSWRTLNNNYAESLSKTENPRLRRALKEEYYSFLAQYDYKFPDRKWVEFGNLFEKIAKGEIVIKSKQQVSELFLVYKVKNQR